MASLESTRIIMFGEHKLILDVVVTVQVVEG